MNTVRSSSVVHTPTSLNDPSSLSKLIIADFSGPLNLEHKYNGLATLSFKSGNQYEGEMAQGYMEGNGKYIWKDGIMYEGTFQNNKISGEGRYTW